MKRDTWDFSSIWSGCFLVMVDIPSLGGESFQRNVDHKLIFDNFYVFGYYWRAES